MTWTVFRKELLDLLLSWRFAAFAAMLGVLGFVVVVARSAEHEQALRDYAQAESLHSAVLGGGLSMGQSGGLLFSPPRRPAPMSPVAQGTQQSFMERFLVSVYEDPIPVLYPPVDLLTLMGIVISLGALLLASDQICGDRETGSLRLVIANPIKRSSILLGKWLACLSALGTGTLLLFVVVAVVMTLARPDAWPWSEWVAFGILFLFSLVYASAFLLIGLFLSAATRHSGTAAILALLVWTLTVFVLPSLPVYLARELLPAQSPTYLAISGLRAEQERNEALNRLRAPLKARGLSNAQVEEELDKKAVERISAEFREKRRTDNTAYNNSLFQGLITAVVDQGSPYAAYVLGGAEIAGVGAASMASFHHFSQGQEAALSSYLDEKWKEAAKKNPDLEMSAILDTHDYPRGVYEGDPLPFRMAGLTVPLLSLGVFNGLFFMLAWRRLLRYDVR
jgi:ABC-type transport system involved in multi-copper enzyme maturation permease subunit